MVEMDRRSIFALSAYYCSIIPFDKYDKDFTFIIDGKKYKTSRFYADLVSPIICKYHYTDETINEFTISTNNDNKEDDDDYFTSFIQLSKFNEDTIVEPRRSKYIEYFFQLGNIDEYLRLQPDYFESLSPNKVISHLKILRVSVSDMSTNTISEKLINYASNNFDNIPKDELKTLGIDMIERIIDNEHLLLFEEDGLLEFIIELYKEDSRASSLFEFVIFSNVKETTLKSFIDEFDINDLNIKTWKSICDRLLNSSIVAQRKTSENQERYREGHKSKIEAESDERIVVKEHREGDEFNGILRYLTDVSGGNIHDNGTINITSNSIYDNESRRQPKNLVDYQNIESNFYLSKYDVPNANVCFDFKDRKIQLTNYSIKSYSNGTNCQHLKNWNIEVSNDGENWTTIDSHQNDSTLNGSKIIGTFNIQQETEFYRFIRLHQTGKNWENDDCMLFYVIEFYGKLKEPKSNSK